MTANVPIDQDIFNLPIRTRSKGITIEVALSPYDVPASVNGQYCTDRKKFVIEFNYLAGREKTRSRNVSEFIVVHEGETSGRIRSIEVDVDELQVKQVRLNVKERLTQAIELLGANESLSNHSREGLRSKMNARVLGEVRDHCLDQLVMQ